MWWVSACSRRSSPVIRKPERTKNRSTPRNPPRAQPKFAWYSNTATTAKARKPSRAGTRWRTSVFDSTVRGVGRADGPDGTDGPDGADGSEGRDGGSSSDGSDGSEGGDRAGCGNCSGTGGSGGCSVGGW